MKVSIVTPSYNQGVFIARTIESVLAQRSDDYELEHLIFDGGSSDSTVHILQSFGDLITWVSEPDRGQTHAINKGFSTCQGEIVGWLNSDDIYYPGAVADVVKVFQNNPEVDVVYGQADHIDIHDQPFEEYPTEVFDLDRMKETCTICQPSLFLRRRVIEEHGLLDESLNFCMDYEYWLRLGKASVTFKMVDRKLAGSRLYADNKTLAARIQVHAEINLMFKKLFGLVPDRWIANFAHVWVAHRINRDRRPRLFLVALIFVTIVSSFRWNKSLPPTITYLITSWILAPRFPR